MTDLTFPRKVPDFAQISTDFNKRIYQLIRPPQRHYYRSGPNSPSLFWHLHGPKIVAGSVVGLCITSYAANLYAEDLARRTHNFKPLDFMQHNFVSSLDNVKAGKWWVMATSSLMHSGYLHLGLNMWALWSVGPAAVSYFGAPQFIGLWLVSAISCSAASLYWTHYKQELRRDQNVGRQLHSQARPQWTRYINLGTGNNTEYYGGAVGASGSLFGFFTAIMCMMPRAPVGFIGIPFVSFPMWFSNAAIAAGSVYCMMTGAIPYISHAGHLGGMAGGIVYYVGVIRPFFRFRGRRL